MQRNMTARLRSLTALIPGIRPDLLLIKQVDQVRARNGRLLRPGGDAVGEFARRFAVAVKIARPLP